MWAVELLSERVASFLASDEGERVLKRYLGRQKLSFQLIEDVAQRALLRVVTFERRNPEFEPSNLAAWTSRVVHRTTQDVVRGRVRRGDDRVFAFDTNEATDDFWDHQADDRPGVDEEVEFETVDLVIAAERVDGVRRRLALGLAKKPYPVAAAMCMVTITCDGAEPAEDCPRPRGGVSQDQAPWWAAVFYSGKTNCFALNGVVEDDAMRARRSRALKEAKAVLEEATRG